MRSLTDLKSALKASPDASEELLKELYEYCAAKKRDPAEILSSCLTPIGLKVWKTLADQHPFVGPRTVKADDLSDHFHFVRRSKDDTSHSIYPVRDAALKIVDPAIDVNTLDESAALDFCWTVNKALKDNALQSMGDAKQLIAEIYSSWDSTLDGERPIPFGQPGGQEWALERRTIEPDPSVPFPSWERFLGGCDDGEALAAKLYAIATGRDTSRQALVIHGPDGLEGKSSAIDAFISVVYNENSEVAKPLANEQISSKNKFTTAGFRNSALIYVPDTNNGSILLSGMVKQLTGTDRVAFEVKGKTHYGSFEAKAKFIVCMNPRPRILSGVHSTSRILYIRVLKNYSDDEKVPAEVFKEMLKAEMAGFLAYGEACFEEKWKNNQIVLNEKAQKVFDNLIGGERQAYDDFMHTHFTFDEGYSITRPELRAFIERKNKKLRPNEVDDWISYLEDDESILVSGVKTRKYKGVGRNNQQPDMRVKNGASGGMSDA